MSLPEFSAACYQAVTAVRDGIAEAEVNHTVQLDDEGSTVAETLQVVFRAARLGDEPEGDETVIHFEVETPDE
jgi:hypothetical protein